jgi:ATP-binding cassette subfamily B (MDR/TAP) protein 1
LIRYNSTFIAGLLVGFINGWKMSLVMLSVVPLLAACGAFIMKVMASIGTIGQAAYADAGAIANEAVSGIKTVASFSGEDHEVKRYSSKLDKAMAVGVKRGFLNGLGLGLMMAIIFWTYALAMWYGGELVADGEYTGGKVLTVFFSVLMGAFALGQTSPSQQALAKGQAAAAKLFETINRKPEIDGTSDEGKRISPEAFVGQIQLNNIHFHYPTRPDSKVLRGLNLSIREGQMIALVGPSGCGKSSIVSLIQRFYDPVEGEILVDDVNLKELNVKWWRQQLGLVSQEPVLFAGTIADNIRFGKPDATQEEIEAAAKSANAHNFIVTFPDQYNTYVGEKGAQLSGGQKQRIAIARAIIKNPKVLLLDEATSALDSESEKIVQEALDQVMKGRTTIVIAHRLSTIRDANVIAVIKEGQVAELGNHEELIARNGLYAELVAAQQRKSEDAFKGLDGDQNKEKKKKIKSAPSSPDQRRVKSIDGKPVPVDEEEDSTEEDDSKDGKKKKKKKKQEDYQVSLGRLFKLNTPEIPYFLIGSLAAAINGVIQPMYCFFSSLSFLETHLFVFFFFCAALRFCSVKC